MNEETPREAFDFGQAPLPGPELHRVLARLRERAPVCPVSMAGRPAWLIVGHGALSQAFRDEVAFPAGEWYRRVIEPTQGRTFESMEGSEHLLYRRLATPAFRSRSVERMQASGIAELAGELLDAAVEGGGQVFDLAFLHPHLPARSRAAVAATVALEAEGHDALQPAHPALSCAAHHVVEPGQLSSRSESRGSRGPRADLRSRARVPPRTGSGARGPWPSCVR